MMRQHRIVVVTSTLLLILAVGSVFTGGVIAQSSDTTEPIIQDATIQNDTVSAGEKLVVTANATDESKLIEARVRLRITGSNVPYGIDQGPNGTFVITKFDRSGLNKSGVQFNTTISDSRLDGSYELDRVTFIDSAGNDQVAYDGNEFATDSVEINTPNNNYENNDPDLQSVDLLTDTVQPGEEVALDVYATDASDIICISAELELQNPNLDYDTEFNDRITLEVNKSEVTQSGTTRLAVTVPETQVEGEYNVRRIEVTDEYYNDGYFSSNDYSVDRLTVEDAVSITDAANPTISNVYVKNSSVQPGENLTVELIVDKAGSPIVEAEAVFDHRNYYGGETSEIEITNVDDSGLGEAIRLTTTIPNRTVEGEYRLDDYDVSVTDAARNTADSASGDFSKTVNIGGTPPDNSGPQISNISVANESIQAGDEVIVTANVSDETGIESVTAFFNRTRLPDAYQTPRDYENDVNPEQIASKLSFTATNKSTMSRDNGTVTLTATVPPSALSGDYKLTHVRATDVNGAVNDDIGDQYTDYRYGGHLQVYTNGDISPLSRVTVSGDDPSTLDTIPPKITDFDVLNNTVEPGNDLVIEINATDENGLSKATAGAGPVIIEGTPGALPEKLGPKSTTTLSSGESFKIALAVPEDTPSGTLAFSNQNLSVYDNDRNQQSIEPQTLVKIGTIVSPNPQSGSYTSIQAAIDNASAGETIEVRPGTYNEELTIDKDLQLVATDGAVLDGSDIMGETTAMTATSASITPTVDGFHITGYDLGINATGSESAWSVRNTAISTVSVGGIAASGSTGDWRISNISITDSEGYGVNVARSTGNWTASDLTIENTTDVSVDATATAGSWKIDDSEITNSSASGIAATESTGNWNVQNATLTNTTAYGITVASSSAHWEIESSTIQHVTQSNNLGVPADGTAIYAAGTQDNGSVSGSVFIDNDGDGLNASAAQFEIDATRNYWGAADGPGGDYSGTGASVVGNVTAVPYFTSSDLSSLSTPLSSTDVTTLDATNATVTFELKNDRKENNSYILNLSLPDGWAAVNYSDDGGDRQTGESKWLWQTISPGETVAPSVTVSVPENVNGTYDITGEALIEGENEVLAQENATVSVLNRDLTATIADQTIANGSETAVTVQAPQADGSFVDRTDEATYDSNDTDVATIDKNGTVTAISNGTATLNASYNGRTDNVTVTVVPASVEQAIDEDNDGEIGGIEVLSAIGYWQNNEAVPRTDGKTIGDFEILDLIEKWRYNTEI